MSAGSDHACGVTRAGRILCWGDNEFGQAIPPTNVRFKAVTAGTIHSCGITVRDRAVCWGENSQDDPALGRVGSIEVPPTFRFLDLQARGGVTCGVLKEDRQIRCWGKNDVGQRDIGNAEGLAFTQVRTSGFHT